MNKRLSEQSPGKDVVVIDDGMNKPSVKSKVETRRLTINKASHTPNVTKPTGQRAIIASSKYSTERKISQMGKSLPGISNVQTQDITPTTTFNRNTPVAISQSSATQNNILKRKAPARVNLVQYSAREKSKETVIPVISEATGKIINSTLSNKSEAANGHIYLTTTTPLQQYLPSHLSITPLTNLVTKVIQVSTPKTQQQIISVPLQRKYQCSQCKKPCQTSDLCDICQNTSLVSSSSQVVKGPTTSKAENPMPVTTKNKFMTKERFYGKPSTSGNSYQRQASTTRKGLVSSPLTGKPRGRPRGSKNRTSEPECLTIESSEEEQEEDSATQTCEIPSVTPIRLRNSFITCRRSILPKPPDITNRRQAYSAVKNPADSSVMNENTDHEIIDGDDDIENDEEEGEDEEEEDEEAEEMEEHPNHGISIDETSGKPKSLRLLCRSIRIGSFKIHPINDLPHLPVVVSPDGFCFKVSKITKASDLIGITLKAGDIVQVLGHFGRCLPIMFIFTTPACAGRIRYRLGMVKGSHLYFDPEVDDEKQKRITLLIDNMNDEMKNYLRNTFPGDGILKEIDQKQANEILVKSTPHHHMGIRNSVPTYPGPPPPPPQPPPIVSIPATILQVQPVTQIPVQPLQNIVQTLQSQGTVTVTVPLQREISSPKSERPSSPVRKIVTYPPPPETDNIELNNVDLACLEEGEFLNDKIIDFYLRYLILEALPEKDRERTHVFNSYFYRGLTQKLSKRTNDDRQKSIAELRHRQVKKWTKNLDIFEKDFIIIPINQNVHWFLAIICYPKLASAGKKLLKTTSSAAAYVNKILNSSSLANNKTSERPSDSKDSLLINTISPVKTREQSCNTNDRCSRESTPPDYYESTGDEADSPIRKQAPDLPNVANPTRPAPGEKMPFIILFDSLHGPSRQLIGKTLKEYLEWEWKSKKGTTGVFDTASVMHSTVCVPQQNNYSDCGIYVLQYVESFFGDPFPYIAYPLPDMRNWFSAEKVAGKRNEIKTLIYDLEKRQSTSSDSKTNIGRMEDTSSSTNCLHSS